MLGRWQSFEGWKLCVRVFKHSMQDLASLVELFKPDLGTLNCLRSQSLSVFDECLFNELHHIITATTDSGEKVDELAHLLKGVISIETLVDNFLFNDFPELIILQVHTRGALDCHQNWFHCFSVKSGDGFLH